jgi:hypothetical protein
MDKQTVATEGPIQARCGGTIAGHNGTYSFPCVRPAGHVGGCNRIFTSPEDYTPRHNCGYAQHLTEYDLWCVIAVPVCEHGVLHKEPTPAIVVTTDVF